MLIKLRKPNYDEMSFISELWLDEETMKDVGGVIVFSKDRWESWYNRMVQPTDNKNEYFLIFNDNNIVGEVSYHEYDFESKTSQLNIKIMAKYRGYGFGKVALTLFLDYYFNEIGKETILDDVWIKNINGQKFLENYGFINISQSEDGVLYMYNKRMFEVNK